MPRPTDTTASTDLDTATTGGRERWLNLGVLAHVDAGKTSLTEAILELGGAIVHRGRVDDGTTQTDTLAQERARGITIRAAVATFRAGGVGVNLIDTPGHPDFIAEVDRSLGVLDGAILVVSAVEGVQAQTIILNDALRRMGVPTLLFVNKIDRRGANAQVAIQQIRQRLRAPVVPLGTVRDGGHPHAAVDAFRWAEPSDREELCSHLAAHDESLLAEWVTAGPPTVDRLRRALQAMTRHRWVTPALFGSARTSAGVEHLIETAVTLFPSSSAAEDAPVAAQVFKVERTSRGHRVCTVRLRAGILAVREHVTVGRDRRGTVTALEVHQPGGAVQAARAGSGQIARVSGLEEARVGDWLGAQPTNVLELAFPPPAMESTIAARDHRQQHALFSAVAELADIDPLISLRARGNELSVRLYGAVQQEVIAETLSAEYGIDVVFGPPTVICLERLTGPGRAALRIGDPQHLSGFTMAVTVEPMAPGQGVDVQVTAARPGIPMHVYGTLDGFRAAVLGYLQEPLSAGPHGWQLTDLTVTVTESGYPPAGPQAVDVRRTTALVVADAIRAAGTVVCEPVDRISVEFPAEAMSDVFGVLGRCGVVPDPPTIEDGYAVVGGTVRTAAVDALRRAIRGVAHGEAVLTARPDHFAPIGLPRPRPPREPGWEQLSQRPPPRDSSIALEPSCTSGRWSPPSVSVAERLDPTTRVMWACRAADPVPPVSALCQMPPGGQTPRLAR